MPCRILAPALCVAMAGAACLKVVPVNSCTDGIKNGTETDVDCGGDACGKCGVGRGCIGAADCASGLCSNNVCLAPLATCTDGIRDGNETDVDCGGGVCAPCAQGKHCGVAADCGTQNCDAGVCNAAPTCTDGVKNGTETDVDCGGACPPCGLSKGCLHGADCVSGICSNNACVAPPATCSDGIKDGAETDVDCGGNVCLPCAVGKNCLVDGDCTTQNCAQGICSAAPTCTDGVKNGTETDVDCGGSCPPCALGKGCLHAGDCVSGLCTNNICVAPAPTCTDGIKNGNETDVDCGGGVCPPCAIGKTCLVGTDCTSGLCINGVCTATTTVGFPPTAQITALTLDGGTSNLFVIGNDGAMYWNQFSASTNGWSGFSVVPVSGGTSPGVPGASIAGSTASPGQFDLFYVDTVGQIQTVGWDSASGSFHGGPIRTEVGRGGTGTAPPGEGIGVVVMSGTRLDVFVIDNTGTALQFEWLQGQGWAPATVVSAAGEFAVNTPATAISHDPPNTMELYAITPSGTVWNNWCNNGCLGTMGLNQTGIFDASMAFPPGTRIGAFNLTRNNEDLFGVDGHGQVWRAWWTLAAYWFHPPGYPSPFGVFSSTGMLAGGTSVASSVRDANTVDVMVVDGSGQILSESWTGAGSWSVPGASWGANVASPWASALPVGTATPSSSVAMVPNVGGAGNLDIFWMAPYPGQPGMGQVWTRRATPQWGTPVPLN